MKSSRYVVARCFRQALFDASRRVRVIMRLHERLQIQNPDARVALDDLIRDICGDLAEIDASEETEA